MTRRRLIGWGEMVHRVPVMERPAPEESARQGRGFSRHLDPSPTPPEYLPALLSQSTRTRVFLTLAILKVRLTWAHTIQQTCARTIWATAEYQVWEALDR